MLKVKTYNIGYVWVDVWLEESGNYLIEPYVVKRDGTGRSAKYRPSEIIILEKLISKIKSVYIKKDY